MKFLQTHGVDIGFFDKIKGTGVIVILDDDIHSLEMQTAAYGFTDDQIQKYVQGIVNGPTGQ